MAVMEHTSLRRIRSEEVSTLAELAAELQRLEATRRDDVVDTRRMSFHTVPEPTYDEQTGIIGEGPGKVSYLTWDGGGHDDLGGGIVNDHAHSQIRERLGIPGRYYDRMRAESPDLLDKNVQHWLSNPPQGRSDKRLVRMLDGKVRAFLSNRYRRLDNDQLMEQAVLPELSKYGQRLVFHVAALTPERLYIRAILPDLAADVEAQPGNHTFPTGGGDVVQAGVQITNSEVGAGALSVTPFIWRLRCLNGLVVADSALRRYHVGRELEEAALATWRDDTLAADDRAFFLKVRDAVGAALDQVTFQEVIETMREARTGERIADPVAATERLGKAHTLTEGESTGLLRYLAEGGDLSQWGAVNAMTSLAKDADTFQRQVELEAAGGAMLALPSQEWAAIAR